jgi:hypothetical protein
MSNSNRRSTSLAYLVSDGWTVRPTFLPTNSLDANRHRRRNTDKFYRIVNSFQALPDILGSLRISIWRRGSPPYSCSLLLARIRRCPIFQSFSNSLNP